MSDHIITLNERQLWCLVREYVDFFNRVRPHQKINRIPDPPHADHNDASLTDQRIIAVPVLGRLHYRYRRAA